MTSGKIYKFTQTKDYDTWRKSLRDYLRDEIIPTFLPISDGEDASIKEHREALISDQAMKEIWEPVFTHPSYDPRVDRNFEVHEFQGDKMLGLGLSKYMKMRYPKSTQENLNNYNTAFTSRNPLGLIAREKGMLPHVRTLAKIEEVKGKTKSVKMQSDIVEAVIGGIMTATNRFISPALGEAYAFMYIVSIYNWFMEEHSKERGKSGVINKVMQDYYDTLGWKRSSDEKDKFEIISVDDEGYTVVSIKLNQKAIDFLRDMGLGDKIGEIKKEEDEEMAILATGEGIDKAEATEKAYQAALVRLDKVFGLTVDYARDLGLELLLREHTKTSKEADNIFANLKKRNQKENIKWLKQTSFNDSIRKKKVYNLTGHNDDGIVKVVYRIMFSRNPKDKKLENTLTDDDIRMMMYRGYANKGSLKDYEYIYQEVF